MRIAVLTDVHANLPALLVDGYHHPFSDVTGCALSVEACYLMENISHGNWTMKLYSVPYDDKPLHNACETRAAPERAFIYQAFFRGRFSVSGDPYVRTD